MSKSVCFSPVNPSSVIYILMSTGYPKRVKGKGEKERCIHLNAEFQRIARRDKKVFLIFLIESFIFLVLSCMSCLYIFEINSLSVASFAIIFSHSEACLFTLLIVSFTVQKLLSLIRSHLFVLFLFLFCGRWVIEDPSMI